jgi:hypothetical protein
MVGVRFEITSTSKLREMVWFSGCPSLRVTVSRQRPDAPGVGLNLSVAPPATPGAPALG